MMIRAGIRLRAKTKSTVSKTLCRRSKFPTVLRSTTTTTTTTCAHHTLATSSARATAIRNSYSSSYSNGTIALLSCFVGGICWKTTCSSSGALVKEDASHAMASLPTAKGRLAVRLSQAQRLHDVDEEADFVHRWARHLIRAGRMLVRLFKLTLTLSPVVLLSPIILLLQQQDENDNVDGDNKSSSDRDAQNIILAGWNDAGRPDRWQDRLIQAYLRLSLECVQRSGAAVIKLCQWAGSRPDLFGQQFCAVFGQLQDSTRPHSWKHTEQVLREALGEDWHEEIEMGEIVGSGCIGQVYKGQVVAQNDLDASASQQPKQAVAVKILHPNVEEDIDADLDLMRLAAWLAQSPWFPGSKQWKWLDLPGVVEEFAGLLKLQLDLRTEAAHLERFRQNFANQPDIVFPSLIPGFEPTPHMLVESFCDGVPILEFAREHEEDRALLSKLCLRGVRAVCQMIFVDNYMHGDLHPGNVFISRDGKQFILFDVGIVAEYTDANHETIVDVLSAFIRRDGRLAGQHMMDDSNRRLRMRNIPDYAVNENAFLDKIESLSIKATGKDYLMENLGVYISFICNAAATHHIMINPSFVSAALAVKVQEGIALALDPSIEIWRVATPIIVESEKRRSGVVKGAARLFGLEIPQWLGGSSDNKNIASQ